MDISRIPSPTPKDYERLERYNMESGSYVIMKIIPNSLMISSIQLKYYAWDIAHKKSVSDDSRFTGVVSEARVDLNPHQVEAALFAFKSPLSKGAILADEVGLGKTIEAGIILSEMWAENKRKILIVS